MPHLDLYRIYGLDPQAGAPELAQRLTSQLNATDPRDTLVRSRIKTARTILGGPQRAQYDQHLADPEAPTIDEGALAAMAGQSVPAPERSGLAGAFAHPRVKLLASVAGALTLLLVILAAVIATSSDNGDKADNAAAPGIASNSATASTSTNCWVTTSELLRNTRWSRATTPGYSLLLTDQIHLPSQFAALKDQTYGFGDHATAPFSIDGGLTQYQDKNVGILRGTSRKKLGGNDATMDLAIVSPDGALISQRTYTEDERSQIPKKFDLAKDFTTGYHRIEAEQGVTIPAAAAGDEVNKNFATAIMPDAFDKKVLWVLLRGSAALYKASVFNLETPTVTPAADRCGE